MLLPAGICPLPVWPAPLLCFLQAGVTSMARYTSTESHVDTVFRITVDHDLENEMMVLSCNEVKLVVINIKLVVIEKDRFAFRYRLHNISTDFTLYKQACGTACKVYTLLS